MGGRGSYAAGKNEPYTYEKDTKFSPDGKWEGVKILKGTEESGKHSLPEESHSSWAYIKLKPDGVFHEMRIYDSEHYLVKEIAYHAEPKINNGNRQEYILHVHDYPVRDDFSKRTTRRITEEEYRQYKKFFKGVPEIDRW